MLEERELVQMAKQRAGEILDTANRRRPRSVAGQMSTPPAC